MTLSVIFVSWNTKQLTLDAIASVYRETTAFPVEVLVVDNCSSDGSADAIAVAYPQVILIRNTDNRGFGKANNQALAVATGDYLMFLNTDTVVLGGALEKLVAYLDTHSTAVMVGPKLLYGDMTFQHACRRALPNPVNALLYLCGAHIVFPRASWSNRYKRGSDDPNVTAPVEALSGAAMLFRRKVYEQMGGFDERFFMYGEDLDFCKRVMDRGWETVYVHDAEIIHYGGQSSSKRKAGSIRNFYDAMWLYYRKHFWQTYPRVVHGVVWCGIVFRKYISLLVNTLK
jgi:GT2 family glycosyltransferase